MKTVLVVDDEKEVLNFFKLFLSKIGYKTDLTDSWELALEKYYEVDFDLIILDLHMPGRDGFQIAKEMKHAKPDQKILIMTGLGAGDVFTYLSSAGVDVDDILYKPFSIDKVKSVISKVMGDEKVSPPEK